LAAARSSTAGWATPKASPGGSANDFWDPVATKSRPQASVSTGAPAMELTVSTQTMAPWRWATSAISRIGLSTPVEVSEWQTVTVSKSPSRSASSTISGVW
jgi:hypothetical protein